MRTRAIADTMYTQPILLYALPALCAKLRPPRCPVSCLYTHVSSMQSTLTWLENMNWHNCRTQHAHMHASTTQQHTPYTHAHITEGYIATAPYHRASTHPCRGKQALQQSCHGPCSEQHGPVPRDLSRGGPMQRMHNHVISQGTRRMLCCGRRAHDPVSLQAPTCLWTHRWLTSMPPTQPSGVRRPRKTLRTLSLPKPWHGRTAFTCLALWCR